MTLQCRLSETAPDPDESRVLLLGQFKLDFDLSCRLPWKPTVDRGLILPLFYGSNGSGEQFGRAGDLPDAGHASIYPDGDLQNDSSLYASNFGLCRIGWWKMMYKLSAGLVGFEPDTDWNDPDYRGRTLVR